MHRFFRRLKFEMRYLGRPRWDTNVSPPELVEFIRTHPAGRALDVGCGTGTNLACLAQAGWQVCGMDLSWLAVVKATRRLRQLGLQAELKTGDFTHASGFSGRFDLVLDIGCYHSLAEEERAIYRSQLMAGLAGGGVFLLYAHCKGTSVGGITQEDLDKFAAILAPVQRQDGMEAGRGPSVWLTCRKEIK